MGAQFVSQPTFRVFTACVQRLVVSPGIAPCKQSCRSSKELTNGNANREREYIVNPVAGPLTSSLSSIETFMERLLASSPWEQEPNSYPIPWRSDLAKEPGRKLKIGYYVDDGCVKVQPPHERAVREVVALLQAAGHTSQLTSFFRLRWPLPTSND